MKYYTDNEVKDILYASIDALIVVSATEDTYRLIKCSELMAGLLEKEGSYSELIEKFWFHMGESGARITEDYRVFVPKMGEFKGKVSHKATLEINGEKHILQILVDLIGQNEGEYLIMVSDLDKSESERDDFSEDKVKTIQETYLFSMYGDLNKDMVSSINVSEISDSDMHYEVKYTEWRLMIVNMIWPEDQTLFLEKTDPEYLKAHLKPGQTLSFDCQMKNLEGEYIWVKLTFGRSDTTNEQDFRFVFMVQNIHENSMQLFNQLKKFEKLASHDPLTGVFNHGHIETEINNAIDNMKSSGRTVSLMMFDIDYFKKVNDTYGHATGDEVLKAFSDCVNDKLQQYDIRFGRWGGEEFVCVCYDLTADALGDIAEEIRELISNKNFDTIGKMTCSVGIAGIAPDDTEKEAFKRLDDALYEAKSSGRNCVRIHNI